MTVQDFIYGFVQGTLNKKRRCGNWSVREDWHGNHVLVYRTKGISFNNTPVEEMVAWHLIDGTTIGNGNILRLAASRILRNADGLRDGQVHLMNAGATLIPFTLFTEASLNVGDFKWIVRPKEEMTKRQQFCWNNNTRRSEPYLVDQHFSGACLFEVDGHCFLFDIDRKEQAESGIFNPFLCELPHVVSSIEEAYQALKPPEVVEAEEKGVLVKRQGEFFFVFKSEECPEAGTLTEAEKVILRYPPSRFGFLMNTNDKDTYSDSRPLNYIPSTPDEVAFNTAALRYERVYMRSSMMIVRKVWLEANNNGTRSHSVTYGLMLEDGSTVVSGTACHSEREHADLELQGWWTVVKNTALKSVTVTGSVD